MGSTVLMPASSIFATAASNVATRNLSDDELVKMACEKISPSIFHVKFEDKGGTVVKDHVENLIKSLPDDLKGEWADKKDELLGCISETTTGFVVAEDPNYLAILTCSHSFEACYNASNPISTTTLKGLFKVSVRCDHEELNHDRRVPRVYVDAEVCRLDCKKDMLLLRVKKQGFCTRNHVVLDMADNLPPRRLGLVGMVSWPFDRHRTTVKGNMSHDLRGPEDIYDKNLHGYNFSGSSGAPLVDLESGVIGMLHGGRVECFTYFVSLADIKARLRSWGLIKMAGTPGSGTAAGSSSSSRKRPAP
ncbi:unnamed protein product [Urochloa decumbens]|uniref:Uncharacterized protein n=1 Tax=Urochloa decumbens TaxID=240449 RepID=A0ABC9ENP0_9POAL